MVACSLCLLLSSSIDILIKMLQTISIAFLFKEQSMLLTTYALPPGNFINQTLKIQDSMFNEPEVVATLMVTKYL
jgi:hypothetical protein